MTIAQRFNAGLLSDEEHNCRATAPVAGTAWQAVRLPYNEAGNDYPALKALGYDQGKSELSDKIDKAA